MNVYTSETVEFFTLVLTSGLIAVTALTIASLIGFTVAFVLFRERAKALAPALAGSRAAAPVVEVRPRGTSGAIPTYALDATAAVAG